MRHGKAVKFMERVCELKPKPTKCCSVKKEGRKDATTVLFKFVYLKIVHHNMYLFTCIPKIQSKCIFLHTAT